MNKTLGQNIVKFRKKLNMTQAQLAERLCVTYQTISNWERGVSFPDLDAIAKMCEIFAISSDELFGLKTQSMRSGSAQEKKRAKVVAYYQEKSKSAKLLTVLSFVVLISYVLISCFSNGMIKNTTLNAFLYVLTAPIFLISFVVSGVLFYFCKEYSLKKKVVFAYFILLIAYIALGVIGILSHYNALKAFVDSGDVYVSIKAVLLNNPTGNICMILSNIFYYLSSVLLYFAFKNKSNEGYIKKSTLIYFLCLLADMFFRYAFKYSLGIFYVVSFFILCLIKQDKTVEIPYYTDSRIIEEFEKEKESKAKLARELMPNSMTGIADGNRRVDEVEYSCEPSVKINVKEFFSGEKLLLVMGCIIGVVFIFILSKWILSVADIIVVLGVLPTIFYAFAFLLKKGTNNIKINIVLFLVQIVSLVIQNLIFMENLSLRFLDNWVMVVAVLMQFACSTYFVLFYQKRCEVKLVKKLVLLGLNFALSCLLVIIGLVDYGTKLGMLFFVLIINLITVFIASFSCEDMIE